MCVFDMDFSSVVMVTWRIKRAFTTTAVYIHVTLPGDDDVSFLGLDRTTLLRLIKF